MTLIRTVLAIFISAGLALAPVQAAFAMRMVPMASMGDAANGAPPSSQDCSCCDTALRCPMIVCSTRCVQWAPASDFPFGVAPAVHASLRGYYVPSLHNGLNWQPPTPPPRA